MCNSCIDKGRRRFINGSVTGLAAGVLALSGWESRARAASVPPTTLTAEESLEKLKEGNAHYLAAPELCEAKLLKRREEVAQGQAPWATILTCADSRVPPELLFGGLNLGELFVCRNAGNTADVATLGTIEYGAEHLGSPLVVVMGHSRCGAVEAACEVAKNGITLPGFIGPMAPVLAAPQLEPGIVVAGHGRHVWVETPDGRRLICHPRGKKSQTVVGDQVLWQATQASAAARIDHLKAQIEQTQASLKADEARLGYTRIYAPMAGTVVALEAREGQTLNATYQTPNTSVSTSLLACAL
eukprot:gene818-1085_t